MELVVRAFSFRTVAQNLLLYKSNCRNNSNQVEIYILFITYFLESLAFLFQIFKFKDHVHFYTSFNSYFIVKKCVTHISNQVAAETKIKVKFFNLLF